jgi:hypothetical protein
MFFIEKTDGKPQYPDGVDQYIEWQDKKTKELVQLSLNNTEHPRLDGKDDNREGK